MKATLTFRRPVLIDRDLAKAAHGEVEDRVMDREWKVQPLWVWRGDGSLVEVSRRRVHVPYANVDGVDYS